MAQKHGWTKPPNHAKAAMKHKKCMNQIISVVTKNDIFQWGRTRLYEQGPGDGGAHEPGVQFVASHADVKRI